MAYDRADHKKSKFLEQVATCNSDNDSLEGSSIFFSHHRLVFWRGGKSLVFVFPRAPFKKNVFQLMNISWNQRKYVGLNIKQVSAVFWELREGVKENCLF